MALRTEAYYRTVASDALARVGCVEPPVSIESLVDALAIPVRAVSLPLFFTAALVNEDGLPVIILNWAKAEPERRQALAHLLGHVLLVMNGDHGYPGNHPAGRDGNPRTHPDPAAAV
ncbi:MAG: ImmA/IrrE family metallo-endopeptidase [Methanoregulaceae archaeon]|nr:ImmA/IrrE family metallo-endopeptidase [Methanoregulaceae archaeon]